jgi:hypothetical protein
MLITIELRPCETVRSLKRLTHRVIGGEGRVDIVVSGKRLCQRLRRRTDFGHGKSRVRTRCRSRISDQYHAAEYQVGIAPVASANSVH